MVSVIIPVYNVEAFLRQCLDSVLAQTHKELEVFLVNDGSTDSSPKICEEYAQKYDHINLINQANQGLSGARNTGLDQAKGEFVTFLDSDDWIAPETISTAIAMIKNENADLVLWSRIKEYTNKSVKENPIFDSDKVFEKEELSWLRRRMIGLLGKELIQITRTDALNNAWGKLFKREIISSNNLKFLPTQEVGSEDSPFVIEYVFKCKKVVYKRAFLSHYRKFNPSSLTKNHTNTLWPRFKKLFSKIESIIENTGENNPSHKIAYYNRIAVSIINCSLSIASPRFDVGHGRKIKEIKTILKDPIYKSGIDKLQIEYLPISYKVFFMFCRIEAALPVYLMSKIAQKKIS